MPLTTPLAKIPDYGDDSDHFKHVLEWLFTPAVESAGFNMISPVSKGSEIIHAEIIKQLVEADLVLCDMSALNPNVFFELGIRTALNKPVALVVDDLTEAVVPFDTSMINFHRYTARPVWNVETEREQLSDHIRNAAEKAEGKNAVWRYFGIAQTGVFNPGQFSGADKLDALLQIVQRIQSEIRTVDSERTPEIRRKSASNESQISEMQLSLLQQGEREAIIKMLEETEGNKLEAAQRLGIGRQTLYNKIKEYGIT